MKKDQKTKPWTKNDELSLLQGAGANGLAWIKKHTGNRSKDAVYSKLRAMQLEGGLTRGSYTLNKACKQTGYSDSQLKRARDALKQKWKRTSKNGYYFITEDQLEELTDWLSIDYWDIKHHLYKCVWCYKRDHKHKFYGLCEKCFNKLRGIISTFAFVREFLENKYEGDELEQLMKTMDKGVMVPKKYLKDE